MAYDEDLARRIRELVCAESEVTEKRMFGGLAFLISGNMALAAGDGGIMVRADSGESEDLIEAGKADPVVMRGRAITGWLRVDSERLRTKRQLARWVDLGVGYVRSLPPK